MADVKSERGATLFYVLIFSITAFFLVTVYIGSQFTLAQGHIHNSRKIQARLNSQSGIWYGLHILNTPFTDSTTDTLGKELKTVGTDNDFSLMNTFDSLFNNDSNGDVGFLGVNDSLYRVNLFDSITETGDTFSHGYVEVSSSIEGYKRKLYSKGFYHPRESEQHVILGSLPFTSSDTLLFINDQEKPLDGPGIVDGYIRYLKETPIGFDIVDTTLFLIRKDQLNSYVEDLEKSLVVSTDSLVLGEPKMIQHSDDFQTLSDTIHGPLFIDGSGTDIMYDTMRTIYVTESLQLTGRVELHNITFIVGGEVKLLDKAQLKNVEIFTPQKIFIESEAILKSCSLLAKGNIEILGEAQILDKSIVISLGEQKKKTKTPVAPQKEDLPKKNTEKTSKQQKKKNSTVNTKMQPAQAPAGTPVMPEYSIFIRESVKIDGIIIATSEKKGIFVDVDVEIRGALWTESTLTLKGQLYGAAKATKLFDFFGSIKSLSNIHHYHFPYFMGALTILEWHEK